MSRYRRGAPTARAFASASWRPAALAASLVAAGACVGCQGILGIADPRDTELDAGGSGIPDTSAQQIDGAPAESPDAVGDRTMGTAEGGNVDASESPEVDAPDEDSATTGLDALESQDADAEAGPTPNPCANVGELANGDYCGSDSQHGFDTSQADPDTLYVCSDGSTVSAVVCPHGCQTNNSFIDDSCNP